MLRTYLVTGGTGSLGSAITQKLLERGDKVRVYARGEHRHEDLISSIPVKLRPRLSSLVGDVRDRDRLHRAADGVDFIIHAAAQKVIGLAEYNPLEAVKTNIIGTMNVADVAIDCGVKKAILVSTDKACSPANLYGATKMVAERLWLQSNAYCGPKGGKFMAVRYGNVWGSRGSVLHAFLAQKEAGKLKITDPKMSRFHIRMDQAVEFILTALEMASPGELWIPKLPSYLLRDLAEAVAPEVPWDVVGVRPGEKKHESMVSEAEGMYFSHEFSDKYLVFTPNSAKGNHHPEYNSSANSWRLTKSQLKQEVEEWISATAGRSSSQKPEAVTTEVLTEPSA